MILFSDFDGTLYFGDENKKTTANLNSIEKWRNAGNLFCITTGRSYESVIRQMPQLKNLCDYYIVDSGSIVLSKDGEILNTFYFEPKTIEKIVEFSKSFSEIPILAYYTPSYEGLDYKVNNITKLRLWFKDVKLLHDINEQLMYNFSVFAVSNPVLHTKPNHNELRNYRGFVEVVPLKSGKNNAIKSLIQKEEILPNKIITVGDGLNDLSMVKEFDGFAIEKSELSSTDTKLKTVSSLAELVENKLKKLYNI